MKERGNFGKAFDELLRGKSEDQGEAEDSDETVSGFDPEPSAAHLAALASAQTPMPRQTPDATITADMVIKGSVTSASNINVFGTILGDVVCESDMIVSGRIEGNISARSFQLLSGSISGDISAKSLVDIAQGSSVSGNIIAERITVDSKITGNLGASNVVRLNANAVIDGNIKAGSIAIQEGAELKGNLDIHKAQEQA